MIAGALLMFYTGWLRMDTTAVAVMVAMMLPWRRGPEGWEGLLDPREAFSGFGSPAVVMVAAMFVLSAAMRRTGAAQVLGGRLLDAAARSETLLLVAVMVGVMLFSAFVNDTTTVLIFIPLLLTVSRQRGYAASRLMLPLAFAALLGGQGTLIGTRSNLIISDHLRLRSGEALGFFQFTPVAVVIWVLSLAWVLLVGRRLLPKGEAEPSLAERYDVTEYLTEVMVTPKAAAAGMTLGEFEAGGELSVLGIVRGEEHLPPSRWLRIYEGDVLVVQGRISQITRLLDRPGFDFREELRVGDTTLRSVDLRMVEALVSARSELVGKSLSEIDFHQNYGLSVLAIGRQGRPLGGRPTDQRMQFGDSLLLVGHETELERLRHDPNVLLLHSRALPVSHPSKAWLTLALLAGVAISSATGLLRPEFAIPTAALLAVLTRCVSIRDSHEAVDWPSIVVIGGMISYGLALEKSGSAELLAHGMADAFGGYGAHVLFGTVLLFTLALTQVLDNAAVAIIASPVAYDLAIASGLEPVPVLLGVAICVSSGFMTPVAHEATILVMGPGRYRFRHYFLVGAPLALITWLVTLFLLPLLYPLVP